jgi:hypothetical protein
MSVNDTLAELRQQALPETEAADNILADLQLVLQERAGHLAAARAAMVEHVKPGLYTVSRWYNDFVVEYYKSASTALQEGGSSMASVFGSSSTLNGHVDVLQERLAQVTTILETYTEKLQQALYTMEDLPETAEETELAHYEVAKDINSRGHKGEAIAAIQAHIVELEHGA